MKALFYTGLSFTGFSLVQLTAFTGVAFPIARVGAFLILLGIGFAIAALGLQNWVGLSLKGYAHRHGTLIGFTPALIVGAFFILATICGVYIALGG